MKFSQRLRELRKEEGLTQAELAQKMGISRSSEGMYETQGREPSFELADKYAEFFNVDLKYLLGQTDNRTDYYRKHDAEVLIEQHLPPDQFALLNAYRGATKEMQQATLRMLGVK